VGIYEMLAVSPAVRGLIRPDADLAQIRSQGVKEGMYPLQIAGALKVASGQTSIEEVFRVAGPIS